MKKQFIIFFIISISLITPSRSYCLQNDYLPGELRKIINQNRDLALPPVHPDLYNMMAIFSPPIDTKEDARIADILRQSRRERGNYLPSDWWHIDKTDHLFNYVSHEQLVSDTYFLFDLLKLGYAGYWYFGGDNVFLPVRDSILKQLKEKNNPFQVFNFLHELLVPALQPIINDNHFQLHDITFNALGFELFMNQEIIIHKNDNYYMEDADGIYRINRVTVYAIEIDFETCILPTLTPDGRLSYNFGLLKSESGQDFIDITVYLEKPTAKESYSQTVRLNIRPDLSQFEGIGFKPDLYIPPDESLDRVLNFIDRYELLRKINR